MPHTSVLYPTILRQMLCSLREGKILEFRAVTEAQKCITHNNYLVYSVVTSKFDYLMEDFYAETLEMFFVRIQVCNFSCVNFHH